METIKVTIKPHHLKGNSWSHADSPVDRRCPLEEALKEAGYTDADVSAREVEIEGKDYEIDRDVWNQAIAEEYISLANVGSLEEVHLVLTEIEEGIPL